MDIRIHGAKTLEKFTSELIKGFDPLPEEDFLFDLFQIHASPQSLNEDKVILEEIKKIKTPKVILIHRPDELLLHPELKSAFDQNPEWKIIFLGDLALNDPFWQKRKSFITVIPHFYFSLNQAPKSARYTVGTFTSWGEMRKLEHYLELVKSLKKTDVADSLKFMIGGSNLHVSDVTEKDVQITEEAFIPHFNVQLYHLNGKKRFGESAGSLHSGVTIPVIFEANGMERIEGVRVIKIPANDDLTQVDYDSAAGEIARMIKQNEIQTHLSHNLKRARLNTSVDFANSVISMALA